MSASMQRIIQVLAVVLVASAPVRAQDHFVGVMSATYVDADRGARNVGADLYYPALGDGAGQPVATPPAGGFPVVAIGHGYLMGASLYAWIAEDLARQGCIVAVATTGGELFPSHETFGLDLAFLTRALRTAGDDPASPFFGAVGERCAVGGHSMGGGAAILGAASDPGVTAVFGLASAETSPSAIAAAASLARPFLMFAGTADCVTPPAENQDPMYDAAVGGWRTIVTLDGASHCQFAASSAICSFGESCSAGITRDAQMARTLELLRPWVRAVLMDDGAGVNDLRDLLAAGADLTYREDGVPAPSAVLPAGGALRLAADGPAPFTSRLFLRLEGAAAGPVTFTVHDLRGRLVAGWTAEAGGAGMMRTEWDGRDDAGRRAAAGVYLVRASAGGAAAALRVVRLR